MGRLRALILVLALSLPGCASIIALDIGGACSTSRTVTVGPDGGRKVESRRACPAQAPTATSEQERRGP